MENGSTELFQSASPMQLPRASIPKAQIDRARFNLKYWGLIDYRIGKITGVNTAPTTYRLTFYQDSLGNTPTNDWMCWELGHEETIPGFRKRHERELHRIYKQDKSQQGQR